MFLWVFLWILVCMDFSGLVLGIFWVSFVIKIGMDMHMVLCLAFKLVSVNLSLESFQGVKLGMLVLCFLNVNEIFLLFWVMFVILNLYDPSIATYVFNFCLIYIIIQFASLIYFPFTSIHTAFLVTLNGGAWQELRFSVV